MHFTKQTKFELMRWGRERAARQAREWGLTPITQLAEPSAPLTFEFEGNTYREEPEPASGDTCNGCAFENVCRNGNWEAAQAAFGDSCGMRGVIYLRVDAPTAQREG